jgi:hypothetical protein
MKTFIAHVNIPDIPVAILPLLLLVFGSGCATRSASKVVDVPPDFVRTNWPARRAELKCLHLVAPRVEIVRMDYFSRKELLTNDTQLTQQILPGVVQDSFTNLDMTLDVTAAGFWGNDPKIAAMNNSEARLMAWMCSDDGRNPHLYDNTDCPPALIRKDATNLATAFGDDALLLIDFRGKTNTRIRSAREASLCTFGLTGYVTGACAGIGLGGPGPAVDGLGKLGGCTGWFAGWVVTGFGDIENEFDYRLGTYIRLRVILLDGKTGEVLWSKTCLGDFDRNELDTLVKAVFHQPNL